MLVASVASFVLHEIRHLNAALVYSLVALLVFGEAALFIGFVLPGETSVVVAGVVASQGHVNIGLLCLLVVAAAIVGDSVGYAVGYRYGEQLLTLPLLRKRTTALHKALDGLQRRGPLYVFVGRFTAFLRAVMPGLAGMSRLHYRRFLYANALGGVIWGVGYSLLGYFAGHALATIERVASWLGVAVLVIVIVLVLTLHVRRTRREAAELAAWSREHPDESTESSQ